MGAAKTTRLTDFRVPTPKSVVSAMTFARFSHAWWEDWTLAPTDTHTSRGLVKVRTAASLPRTRLKLKGKAEIDLVRAVRTAHSRA